MSEMALRVSPIQSDEKGEPRLLGYRLKVGGKKYFELMVMGGTARVGILLPCCGRGTSNAIRCPHCAGLPLLRASYDLCDIDLVMSDVLDSFGWDPLSSELAWGPWRSLLARADALTRDNNSKWRGGEWLPPEAVTYHCPST